MGKLDTQSTVTLVLNGEQTKTSLRDLTSAINATRAALGRMNAEDDPTLYRQRISELQRLTQAQRERRAEITGTTQDINASTNAQEGFFAKFKKGFSEIDEMAGSLTAGTLLYKGISWAINGITNLVSGSTKDFEEARKTQAQLEAVLRSTSGAAGENMQALQALQEAEMEKTGVDDDVIAKGEEMLLTFTNVKGGIYEDAIPAILDMSAAMNKGEVSMEGVQTTAIQVGKALNDPISGMTALKKVGVSFTDEQKEQIKVMQESGDVMGAQNIILNELKKEFGGTAESVKTTSQAFETDMRNIREKIGAVIVTVKEFFIDALQPLIKGLASSGDEAAEAAEAYHKTNEEFQTLQTNIVPLISRYEELKSKTSLNAAEHKELNDIVGKINQAIPGVASEFDNYNKVIGISTERAKAFIEQQKHMLEYMNREAIDKTQADLDRYTEKAESLKRQLISGYTEDKVLGFLTGGKNTRGNPLNETMRATMQQRLQEFTVLKEGAEASLKKLKGIVDPIKPAAESTKAIALVDMTIGQLQQHLQELNEKLKDTVSGSASYKKIMDEIAETNKLLNPAKADKEEESAWEKKQRALEKYKDQLQAAHDQVDQLIAKSTSGTIDGLDEQLKVIDDKYQKVIDKLRDLNNNEFATDADKKKNNGMISDLQTADMAEQLGAGFDAGFANDKGVLDGQHADELKALQDKYDQELITEDAYNQQRLAMEQKYLQDEYYLRVTYMQPTADLEAKLADGEIKAKKKAHDETMKMLKEQGLTQKQLHSIEQDIADKKNALALGGLQVLTEVFGKSKALYIAQIALEKAIAIGQIITNEGVEIAKYWAYYAGQGPAGWVAAGALSAAAQTRAGLSIALIAAQGIGEVVGALKTDNKPKAAKGALIPTGPSHAEGGIDLVNNRTGEHLAEMEGGEPLLVLSRDTYSNNRMLINELLYNSQYRNGAPVMVNTAYATRPATMMMASGGIANAGSNSIAKGGEQSIKIDNSELIEEMRLTRQAIKDQKIWFSMREFHRTNDKLTEISENANG